MNPIQFDQLPDLCLRKVFAFLGLRDLVRCRAVNRQFKSYADRIQVRELVVCPSYCVDYVKDKNWFETNRSIDLEGAISLNALKKSAKSPFKLNQQVTCLYFYTTEDSYSALRTVGSLKQLIHLEFRSGHSRSDKARTLTLPNLKVLSIECSELVVLNTPKLEALQCVMNKIQLEHPETIKRFECISDRRHDLRELTKLSSLEVLHVELHYHNVLDGIHLSNFVDLKELSIKCSLGYREDYEQLRSSLFNLMHEKSDLLRDDLKLYLNDVLLADDDQLLMFDPILLDIHDWYDRTAEIYFKFMNYRLLRRDSYPEADSVDFNRLMRLDFEISEDFFDRFPRIQKLTATDLVDQEQLEWFLQNATALSELKLGDTRLGQAFVDRLPKLCSLLTSLELYENSELVTNFQFLLQFEHLEVFKTNQPLHSFDLASSAFRKSKNLKTLYFRTGSAFVMIERSSALEDNYSLRLFQMKRNREITRTLCHENLSWTQLEALYEQKRKHLIDEPEKRMRVKRARLD